MSDIITKYNVQVYSAAVTYSKYDVVKLVSGGRIYYFVSMFGQNLNHLVSTVSNSWWTRFDDYTVRFDQIWTPTVNTSFDWGARLSDATLGGVNQLKEDGINSVLSKAVIAFEDINDKEAYSLLCYHSYMGSRRSFLWMLPAPFSKILSYKFTNLKHSFVSRDRHSISINAEQTFSIFGVGAGQDMS